MHHTRLCYSRADRDILMSDAKIFMVLGRKNELNLTETHTDLKKLMNSFDTAMEIYFPFDFNSQKDTFFLQTYVLSPKQN